MSIFRPRRPRPFNHRLLYIDERKERLKAIEQRARRELEEEAGTIEPQPEHETLLGAFHKPLRRNGLQQPGYSLLMNSVLLILMVLVLIVIWNLLIS